MRELCATWSPPIKRKHTIIQYNGSKVQECKFRITCSLPGYLIQYERTPEEIGDRGTLSLFELGSWSGPKHLSGKALVLWRTRWPVYALRLILIWLSLCTISAIIYISWEDCGGMPNLLAESKTNTSNTSSFHHPHKQQTISVPSVKSELQYSLGIASQLRPGWMESRDSIIFSVLNMTRYFSKVKTWLPGSPHYMTESLDTFHINGVLCMWTLKHLLAKTETLMHTFYSGSTNKCKDPFLKQVGLLKTHHPYLFLRWGALQPSEIPLSTLGAFFKILSWFFLLFEKSLSITSFSH